MLSGMTLKRMDNVGVVVDDLAAADSAGPNNAAPNTLGIRRIMFAVEDIDDVVARPRADGAEVEGVRLESDSAEHHQAIPKHLVAIGSTTSRYKVLFGVTL